jgi:hypothetical protein
LQRTQSDTLRKVDLESIVGKGTGVGKGRGNGSS